jgi:EAL domain-containing protein (putative c-di-GMP-specific phosphodiesterase class I)
LQSTLEDISALPELAGDAGAPGGGNTSLPAVLNQVESIEDALARAIERKELFVEYQAIVDRMAAGTSGVEALLRWRWKGEVVSPAVFIPLAEKTGVIHELGEWVLRQACLDALAWPNVDLSVNVSAVQFAAPDLASRVARVVADVGFDWRRLHLEITETALLSAEEAVLNVMTSLRREGASFALDDFGTGYSSLTYLRRFPFDRIKIDRSFVADVSLTVNATIVHAIISIGRALGLKVVAEGVETAEQQRFLTAAGVHFLQGYRFGHPVSAEAMAQRLQSERDILKMTAGG